MTNPQTEKKAPRPPVVVVMGHIDHGKSTLLDYIRKANTTEKEAGGITQHISAYEAEVDDRKITFLDTPGHEAFCSIRERGARVADIAILVVSAEDGVKPQTSEALKCIADNNMPFMVAITKIDRPAANVDKVKQNLAENNVLVEGWGGTVPAVPVSGKTGEGVAELLEMIALQADIEGFKGDPSAKAEGFVIESSLSPKQGISATLIIKDGVLETGEFVAAAGAYAPVRSLEDYGGKQIKKASFSSPVRIVGWSQLPAVGSEFKTFAKKDDASEFASQKISEVRRKESEPAPASSSFWEVVAKADTLGSLSAVEHELKKLGNEKISAKIVSKGVGAVNENDVKAAGVSKSIILGFNVDADKSASALAERDGIEIKTYDIIYELVDYARQKMREAAPVETVEKVTGGAKVLKTFSKNKDRQVVGCRVEEGEIKAGASVKIFRRDSMIGGGKIKELQIQKIKTDSVRDGQEFGMMVESKTEVVPGDVVKVISLCTSP